MRILVYKDSLSTGRGADRAVRNFAAALAERGHTVRLIEREALGEALGGGAFDVFVATGSNEMLDLAETRYFARPDRRPVVLQLHLAPSGFFKWRHPLRNRRIRRSFNLPDAVQLLCTDYVAAFKAIAPHPRTAVIGNFTDRPSVTEMPSERQPVVLYPAAAFTSVKNQMLLLRAFRLVADEFPAWKLELLGRCDTSYGKRCRGWVDSHGLSDRVAFAGFSDDPDAAYARAAFVAFPSRLEGFPLAVLEAARFKLPVVAHEGLPGVGDIVHSGETGLVTVPTVKAYAAGLRRLMADAELRRDMGEKARAYCAEHYAREKILDQWEELLKSVIRAAGGDTSE